MLEKMPYVIANPTVAGIVRSPQRWPGAISMRLGDRQEGAMSASAILHFEKPPMQCVHRATCGPPALCAA